MASVEPSTRYLNSFDRSLGDSDVPAFARAIQVDHDHITNQVRIILARVPSFLLI